MRSAKLRMGEVKEEDLDENGLIKDEERWNYITSMREIERKIKMQQIKHTYDLDNDIRGFIINSFN